MWAQSAHITELMERSKPALSEEMPDLEKRKRRRIPLSKLNCKKVKTTSC